MILSVHKTTVQTLNSSEKESGKGGHFQLSGKKGYFQLSGKKGHFQLSGKIGHFQLSFQHYWDFEAVKITEMGMIK